ncbi:MAG: nitrate- and nitrite sensing domain-containing protein [Methyloversatilis sp.]|uniref:nitrate- and nitrite sensing domain-containing protein n=1 Tax=Methyloversatilis sp. TaxID=2569862 RepID=UPI002732E127|nr:nitrate- and nitrite sensing domain-containing protein [Methyloversatilis sp.]MDP3873535.1 nitrate- and nitrite sensing domain-containing protein [Methyloversatilis sp.]
MLTTLVILAALAATTCILLWQRRSTRTQMVQTALRALDGCAVMLQLVRALQQHRGMSVAWLAGDAAFGAQMAARRQDIDRCIVALEHTARAEDEMPRACVTHNDLMLFRFQWRELVDLIEQGKAGAEQSIARHGLLVSRALEWLAGLGEARVELGAAGCVDAGRVRNHIGSLPALAEYLGQARAIGTGVAARGQCAPVARVRLMYLASRIESLLRQALAASDDSQAAIDADRSVGAMMSTLRRHLLGGAAGLNAEAWFAGATRAIDGVYAWIDECGADLRRELASPSAGLRAAA